MDMKKYLAYGANLNLETMARRCPTAKFLGTGLLADYRLMFKGEDVTTSFATIEQWDGYAVPFVLWDLPPDAEKKLDRYEGYPIHYQKREVEIEFCGEKISAMYYQKSPKQRVYPPILHYYAALLESYEAHGFDQKILESALEFSDYRF